MSNFTYETQGASTYLVYKLEEQDVIDNMSMGMLTNNNIPGLAKTVFTQVDSQKFIKFNVSAKISVSQFFAGSVNKKRLLGVFTGIVNAMIAAEDYMLEPTSIIMDLDYIFTDVSTCETDLICLPLTDIDMKLPDIGMFFRNIMFNTQFDQTENCDYVAKIINYLNGTPLFSPADFKKLLEEISGQRVQPVLTKVNNDFPTSTIGMQSNRQPVATQPQPVQAPVQQQPAHQSKITPPPANNAKSGINVPPVQGNPQTVQPTNIPEGTGQKISFFYLMQHYNKENAAAYKAQKEAKKRAAAARKGKTPAQQDYAKEVQPTVQPSNNNFGFAVPGQSSPVTQPSNNNSGFAVPGQSSPVIQPSNNNSGFAVPGQSASATQPSNNNSGFAVPGQSASATLARPVTQQAFQTSTQPSVQNTVTPEQQPAYVPRQASQGQSANFGETTVLSEGVAGETTVLTATNNPNKIIAPHLIRRKNNEKISLNKPIFRVGKERSYVDYFIGDNTAISRSHANFIIRDGECFVMDTNSTNHTFVNGMMIQSNVETAISHGDSIRLANEDFDFKLY